MIRKVSIRNYKSLRDVTVDLERFTVFVGPNGSGKSSVLQAMDILCQTFHPETPAVQDGVLRQSQSRGAADPIELAAEVRDQAFRYRAPAQTARSANPNVAPAKWNGDGRAVASSLTASDWKQWKPGQLAASLPSSTLLRLEARRLAQPMPANDPTWMGPDGTGFHSALANIALSDPETWQVLQDHLRRIVPTVRRLRHSMQKSPNSPALLFDMRGADSLPADQVSEGTLLVLGLLAALHSPARPELILLEDLDRGLHPKAQRDLIGLFRGLLEVQPDLQLVATTHSPYLLGSMEPTEVRMTHLDDGGSTVVAPLTHHPKFETWKDEMSSGEMWSLFGEKWVIPEEVTA